jgi:hypothetical protein
MHQKDAIIRHVETEDVFAGLRHDGIVHVFIKDFTELTPCVQDKLLGVYATLTENRKVRFIVEGGDFLSITPEARKYALEIEAVSPMGATAVLVKNLAQKLVADFFQFQHKPQQHYKVFTRFTPAVDWLLNIPEEALLYRK